jgi:quinoprotein glucose dehydrogenase
MSARTLGEWTTVIFGVVLLLLGLAIGTGGIWLIVLGGSWYYALAGFGLLLSGLLLTRLSQDGAWLYLIVYLGTWIWAIWEVGLDGWALVPRLVAPTVLALIMLAVLPVLRRHGAVRMRPVLGPLPAAIAVAAMAVIAALATLLAPRGTTLPRSTEQAAQAPAVEMRMAAETMGLGIRRTDSQLDHNDADTWVAYGANNRATRFSPANQITPENVAKLDVAWHFHTGDLPERRGSALPQETGAVRYAFQNTPLKVNDTLYVCTPSQQVIALDPATGQQKWRFNPNVDRRAMGNVTTSTCRGVAYTKPVRRPLNVRSGSSSARSTAGCSPSMRTAERHAARSVKTAPST